MLVTPDLCSSILQYVCSIHSADLQAAVTNARDFETAELEANYAQVVNLVMNKSSELDSKLKQFSKSINQKLEQNENHFQNQLCLASSSTNQQWLQEMCTCHYCDKQGHLQFECQRKITANLLITNLLTNNTCYLLTTVLTHLSATALGNLLVPTNPNTLPKLISKRNPKTKINTAKLEIINSSPSTNSQFFHTTIRIVTMEFGHQNYLSLLVTPEDTTSNHLESNQKQPLTSNILLTTVTNDKLLAAIFPFKLEELTSTPLFSGAALKEKPITMMYTDIKVDGHLIKLILDSGSADSIITRQLMDQLGC
ncbi:hypothetical protein G9A89_003158 [Geosiphon pyriformis]|nr:hypothetical protein G9A89_003158 [Geosiphon pyriformis]